MKRKIQLGIAAFDASEYLDNEEVIAEYLEAALEDRNADVFLHAVADVAKARGISKVAKARYDTVRKVLDSRGVRLTVTTGRSGLR